MAGREGRGTSRAGDCGAARRRAGLTWRAPGGRERRGGAGLRGPGLSALRARGPLGRRSGRRGAARDGAGRRHPRARLPSLRPPSPPSLLPSSLRPPCPKERRAPPLPLGRSSGPLPGRRGPASAGQPRDRTSVLQAGAGAEPAPARAGGRPPPREKAGFPLNGGVGRAGWCQKGCVFTAPRWPLRYTFESRVGRFFTAGGAPGHLQLSSRRPEPSARPDRPGG